MRTAGILSLMTIATLAAGTVVGVPAAARFLEAREPLEPADFICVFAGDYPFRALHAAQLYQEGYAARVITTGALVADELCVVGLRITGAQLSARVLQQKGVPVERIEALSVGSSTLSEARAFQEFVATMDLNSVIVVTSPYHVRRARSVLAELLKGRGVKVMGSAAPTSAGAYWWRTKSGLIHLNNELLKLGFHKLPAGLRNLMLKSEPDSGSGSRGRRGCPAV